MVVVPVRKVGEPGEARLARGDCTCGLGLSALLVLADELRGCATCSGCTLPGGSTDRQSEAARRVVIATMLRSASGVARTSASVMMRMTCSCTVCSVHVDAAAAQRSSARLAIRCTRRSSSATGASWRTLDGIPM